MNATNSYRGFCEFWLILLVVSLAYGYYRDQTLEQVLAAPYWVGLTLLWVRYVSPHATDRSSK